MKNKLTGFPFALILVILIAIALTNSSNLGFNVHAQGRGEGRQGGPNISPEEQTMVRAIMAAPDPAAKLKAAGDLIKKYPKTQVRPRVARNLADQITGVTDGAQKLSLSQDFLKIFNQPSEAELIIPAMIDAYVATNQIDAAFTKGEEFLSQHPDAVQALVDLMLVGTEQAKKQNAKFIPQSLKYGAHAIELMETNKKPADMDDAGWQQFKTTYLPAVYQSMGLLYLIKGDRAEAKARFTKASELAPGDAYNIIMQAEIVNEEYQNEAKRYQAMPAGPTKDEELKKAQTMLDLVIDAYAHSIAASEGNATFKAVRDQFMQDLEAYYKYRHNNSTAGMQALIDKYKAPAKP